MLHSRPGAEKIIWEHARRNFLLRARGLLPIVCPITDGGNLAGIGIFNADIDEAKSIMDQDPRSRRASSSMRLIPAGAFPETPFRRRRSGIIKAGRAEQIYPGTTACSRAILFWTE